MAVATGQLKLFQDTNLVSLCRITTGSIHCLPKPHSTPEGRHEALDAFPVMALSSFQQILRLVKRDGFLSCCCWLHRCCSQCCAAARRATRRGASPLRAASGCLSQAGRPSGWGELALCCCRSPHSPELKPRSSQGARSSQEGDREGRQGVGAGKSQSLVTYRCVFVMEFCDTGVCTAPVSCTCCLISVVSLALGALLRLGCRGYFSEERMRSDPAGDPSIHSALCSLCSMVTSLPPHTAQSRTFLQPCC